MVSFLLIATGIICGLLLHYRSVHTARRFKSAELLGDELEFSRNGFV